MSRSVKVAVIGAGVSGLRAAHELNIEAHKVTVFEKADQIGGTWLYDAHVESDPLSLDPTRKIVHGSLYRNLRTNLPRQLMSFSDFSFPNRVYNDPRTFPGHEEVFRFLSEFAAEFRLAELVRFNSEVVRVAREGNEWVVEWMTRGSDSVSRESFDAVVLCNGNFVEPEVAPVNGIEKWPGYQIHSHNYRVPEQFRDQTVVLIGYGASAVDISRDVATEAKEVHISSRNPNVKVGKLVNHNNIWQHMMIKHVNEDSTVDFLDGSSVRADTIFYCTGYKYHYPFLDTNGIVTVEENRVGPLYKHVFPPKFAPSLSFIGITIKGLIFATIELQCKWVARVLSGKSPLPNEDEMMSSIEDLYTKMEENGLPKRSTHFLLHQMGYQSWVCDQIGLPRLEEWRYEMYKESINNIIENRDGYKDQWDNTYWERVIEVYFVDILFLCLFSFLVWLPLLLVCSFDNLCRKLRFIESVGFSILAFGCFYFLLHCCFIF